MISVKLAALLVVLASFLISAYFYPLLPYQIASHWDASGNVNGHMSKLSGLFFVPLITLALVTLFMVMPKIDPLKQNIKKFRGNFDSFVLVLVLFMLYIHVLTILWNIDIKVGITQAIAPAMGGLFYYCGVLIEKSKRNYFIGIRTPWTLSSDRVWDKTAKVGGKLFKISGTIMLLGIIVPSYAFFLIIVPAIMSSAYAFVYSYVEFNRKRR
jgi:uncharacterized membrane protein